MHLDLPDEQVLSLDRPRIMGILNVTPDSFSDGGQHDQVDAAIAHALQMVEEGADIIDIGGESTRPGSERVSASDQIERTQPVIAGLCEALKPAGQAKQGSQTGQSVIISIDTMSSEVAEAAMDAGAVILNDVSAGAADPRMFEVAAKRDAAIVLMHMQGTPGNMQKKPKYDDAVAEIREHVIARASDAEAAGIGPSQIMIDPGIGFGKSRQHNLELLAHLDVFAKSGYPVLLGTSRKRFMGAICVDLQGNAPVPSDLIGATCATTALGVANGVMMFRVHDVKANRQAADVAWALTQSRRSGEASLHL